MGQLKDNCQQENTDKTMSYLMSSRVTANSSEFQLVSERPSPSDRSIREGNESHLESHLDKRTYTQRIMLGTITEKWQKEGDK